MGRNSLIIFSILMIATLRIAAQGGPSTFDFIENKGQWDKLALFKSELPTGEFYMTKNGFIVNLHNGDDLMKYFDREHNHIYPGNHSGANDAPGKNINAKELASIPPDMKVVIRSHCYSMQFVGANENCQIIPEKMLSTYNNYFIGNDPSKWADHVKIYEAVTYKNVYPNIDVRYHSENGNMKYDIIINPGGDLSQVAMRYDGPDKLQVKNNQLIIKTSVGDVKELAPYSFQFDKMTGKKEIASSYVLVDKNTVKFRVDNYSHENTLIVDPTIEWCSFTGSKAAQWGYTATPGPDGSAFTGGIVFDNGFIVTRGAYQTGFQGGSGQGHIDVGLMKFNIDGTQELYGTYLGGSGNEHPHSIISDPQGNLVIMGRTNSPDFPTFPKGNNVGSGGGEDLFVTKLNAAGGGLIGSMRIGGRGMDCVNVEDQYENGGTGAKNTLRFYGDDSHSEVILDNAGNIYVACSTQSDDFPIVGTVFQPTYAGSQDGVVLKINPTCTNVLWSSFIGGSGIDAAFVLTINPNNNDIYVAGGTTSSDLPGNKTGVYQPTYGGGVSDGFVAEITNDGSTLVRSTYMGTPSFDAIYGIQFDVLGFPYVMGVSEGAFPVINSVANKAGSKQFIGKLKPDLSAFLYSTVFGSGSARPNISPVAFLVDKCENVYVSGWGGWITPDNDPYQMSGPVGMPITADATKPLTDNRDFYFIVFKKDAASVLYATYFGQDGGYGEHVDGGTSRYDQQGKIYQAICANCFGSRVIPTTSPFPTTSGVIYPFNGTGDRNCNLAMVKIDFKFAGVAAGPKAYFNGVEDTAGCAPFTITFKDTIRNAKSYIWTWADGTPDDALTNFQITHSFPNVGNYRVRLIAIDSSSCNIRDTAYINIRVRNDPAAIAFNAVKQQPCESLSYRFDNLSTAPAGKPFKNTSFTWDFGDGTPRVQAGSGSVLHAYVNPGAYTVRLVLNDTDYCNSPDSISLNLRIAALVKARFETPASGCAPYDAIFNNTSDAGQTFAWDFGDGSTSSDVSPVHTYPTPGTYTITLVVTDTSTCNKVDQTSTTITVSGKPTSDFSFVPNPPVENKPTIFTNLSTGGVRWKWVFGDGDSTIKLTADTTAHQYNASGTYNACLITINQYGCPDTACKPVQAIVIPLIDVPNAFTPGRFGTNGVVRVKGFGIAKMSWNIYNRWGQKVFESHTQYEGWDGTFNGKPQPLEVYAYTLDVEFTDGTKARKTGDITLIR